MEQAKNSRISDYLYIIYKWKKFLFINLFIVTLITSVIVFLMPNEYRATATIMIPPDQSNFGGIASLFGGKASIANFGSRIFGTASTSEDLLLGILNSRTALLRVVKKFNLWEYYELPDSAEDRILKAFRGDIISTPNEFSMIEFGIINKDPELGASIANYMVALVDSLNIEYNISRAKNNRIFIESRYLKNVEDLRKAEDSLYKFQKKYGIVAVPEQLEVTVKAAAEIEAMLTKKEMEAFFIKQGFGETSPQYQGILAEINLLKSKVQELKNSTGLSASSNVLFPFKQMPDISIQYMRNYREVEIQQAILEIVMPMYEQAKVEEQKSIPTIMVIDKAVPPQLKYAPKRSAIIAGIFFLFAFFLIPIVFIAERLLSTEVALNPLQKKCSKFFRSVQLVYRMKSI